MIQYNPKDWFTFIFRFHKADTFRKLLPMMVAIGAYTFITVYLMKEIFHVSDESKLKNIVLMHNMIGFVISLLLVFRTNTAYDRWWEGRKMWGTLMNSSRNLAIKLSSIFDVSNNQLEGNYFKAMIPNYAFALKNHLKGRHRESDFQNISEMTYQDLNLSEHVPNQIALHMFLQIQKLKKEGKLNGEDLLIINQDFSNFSDVCGACERIKNTPIPFSYSVFIKKFIFFYIMTLPFGYGFSLGYYAIPVIIFIFYVLASLELIAEEIEDPFGGDTNDLPTEEISKNIQKNILSIFKSSPK